MGLRRKSLLNKGTPNSEQRTSCSPDLTLSDVSSNSTSSPTTTSQTGSSSKIKDPFFKTLQLGISSELVASLSPTTEQRVDSAKEQLSLLEKEVISALFPLSGTPESHEAIADRLGLTLPEVKVLADNALRGLRCSKTRTARTSSILN